VACCASASPRSRRVAAASSLRLASSSSPAASAAAAAPPAACFPAPSACAAHHRRRRLTAGLASGDQGLGPRASRARGRMLIGIFPRVILHFVISGAAKISIFEMYTSSTPPPPKRDSDYILCELRIFGIIKIHVINLRQKQTLSGAMLMAARHVGGGAPFHSQPPPPAPSASRIQARTASPRCQLSPREPPL
jgi:hypothetical protein